MHRAPSTKNASFIYIFVGPLAEIVIVSVCACARLSAKPRVDTSRRGHTETSNLSLPSYHPALYKVVEVYYSGRLFGLTLLMGQKGGDRMLLHELKRRLKQSILAYDLGVSRHYLSCRTLENERAFFQCPPQIAVGYYTHQPFAFFNPRKAESFLRHLEYCLLHRRFRRNHRKEFARVHELGYL